MLRRVLNAIRHPSDAEIARELRDHLELEAEALGASAPSHLALRRFGNVTSAAEAVREVWRLASLDQLGQDLRQGWRGLRRSPVYATAAILTLSLGIGAVVAVFGLADPIIDHPFPLLPEEALIWVSQPSKRCPNCDTSSPAAFAALRDRARSYSGISAVAGWQSSLRTGAGSELVGGYQVSANLFTTIGAPFALGNGFAADADQPGRLPTVVLSYRFWRERFNGSRAILDSSITLGSQSYSVVGVLARDFVFPTEASVYTPLVLTPSDLANHAGRYLSIFGRKKNDISLDAARAEARTIASQLAQEAPAIDGTTLLSVQPLRVFHTADVRILVGVFGIAAALVLLAACLSVANLAFARLTARRRDIALRAALGGRRVRLARHLLTEAALIAGVGGLLGIALAAKGASLMRNSIPASLARYSPGWSHVGIHGRAIAFAVLICLASVLLFAFLPVLRTTRVNLASVLTDGERTGAGVHGTRVRSLLVVVQVSVALALLSAATLLTRSVRSMLNGDPGVRRDHVLTAHLALPDHMPDSAVRAFIDRLDVRLQTTAGVRGAGLTSTTPLSNNWWGTTFQIPGRAPAPDGSPLSANDQRVTPDYFRTMGIRLLSGRGIERRDDAGAQRVAVINHFMSEQLFPTIDPIGRMLVIGSERWTIVGVSVDVRHGGFDEPLRYEIYRPVQQAIQRNDALAVWTAGDPESMRDVVRRAVAATDPAAALGDVMTMEEVEARHLSPFKLFAGVLIVFATITTVIAVVGLYGIVAYGVAQRRREIGVRIALGAQRGVILRQVAAGAMRLTGIGVLIGGVGAVAFAQLLESVLYGVTASDPITPLAAAGGLLVVTLVAALLPARSAASVDPVVVLKE